MDAKQNKKSGLGGFLTGFSSLVESLGELLDKVAEEGGEISRQGEVPIGGKKDGIKAVYGFTVRMGAGGARTRVEPFGNVGTGQAGEPVVFDYREPLLDVFEEADHVLVAAELPGIQEKEITLELNGDVLVVKAEGGKTKFYKEVLLPYYPASHTSCYQNGILEVRLERPGSSE